MSNTYKFVWTDELALEFLNFRIKYAAGFPHETVLKHFKQSKEQVEEKRIEVKKFCLQSSSDKESWYEFLIKGYITEDKYEAVKQAIERELNGENANPAPQTPEPKEEPKPLFVTEDGVGIMIDEDYWMVLDMEIHKPLPADTSSGKQKNAHYFKHKEAAEEYILMNKPSLSVNDVCDVYNQFIVNKNDSFRDYCKKLANHKINNKQ